VLYGRKLHKELHKVIWLTSETTNGRSTNGNSNATMKTYKPNWRWVISPQTDIPRPRGDQGFKDSISASRPPAYALPDAYNGNVDNTLSGLPY